MRLATLLLIASMLFAAQSQAFAQSEIVEGAVRGPGLQDLQITGEPDEHGLIWTVNEPERDREPWIAWVLNTNDYPVYEVTVNLRLKGAGDWFVPNTRSLDRMMFPTKIGPGEIGFLQFGDAGVNPVPWSEVKIEVVSVGTDFAQDYVPLAISDLSASGTNMRATVTNDTDTPVSKVNLYMACVQDGEIVSIDFEVSDIISLKPGRSESVTVDTDTGCDSGSVIGYAVGKR